MDQLPDPTSGESKNHSVCRGAFGFVGDQVKVNIDRYGNTTAATILTGALGF